MMKRYLTTVLMLHLMLATSVRGKEPLPTFAPESPGPSEGGEKDDGKVEASAKAALGEMEAPAKKKTVVQVTEGCEKMKGLVDLYLHPETGRLYLYLRRGQLEEEMIYFPMTTDGVVQAGMVRGQYGKEAVVRWRKVFNRLEVVEQPVKYYFDPESPLSRAEGANTAEAVLASEPILAEDGEGFLINAASLFLKESLLRVKRGEDSGRAVLGKLSEAKTHVRAAKAFDDNILVNVSYVFENPSPAWSEGGEDPLVGITDPRYLTVRFQHALVRMPKNEYKPRRDDPRVGYFATQVTDLTSLDVVPYRDVIHRWHLTKQKPGSKLSEPVEPIVFWIENTTPLELRDTIRKAALTWNEAFDSAGFKEALVIKQQPDRAEWDAGDIRYNVLRWTSSPAPMFGGYGPSMVNPRTGQILGADIMLEFSFVSRRIRTARVFEEVGLAGLPGWGSRPTQVGMEMGGSGHFCEASLCAHRGVLFGQSALRLRPDGRLQTDRMLEEALHYLVLHEIGHTLGLTHNFRASHLHDPIQIHDSELTRRVGLTGSVMDYPAVNVAPLGVAQGQFYITKPGPYDHWAIEYGYSEALEDPVSESERLLTIAGRSHLHELGYANDADDMRATGKGIDPRAMLHDMSSDPVAYGRQRCELVKERLTKLMEGSVQTGESFEQLVQDYVVLSAERGDALVAASRQVGGVEVERSHFGQVADGRTPFQPVPKERQVAALKLLAEHGFAPGSWEVSPDLAAHLQRQRRGFDARDRFDPPLHDRALKVQRALLDHLLHPTVLTRMVDTALYGNEMTVGELMSFLSAVVMGGDPGGAPSTLRQNLQVMLLERLLKLAHSESVVSVIQSEALIRVISLRAELDARTLFEGAPAHRELMRHKIRKALDEKGDS